jgi:hypothetical protein
LSSHGVCANIIVSVTPTSALDVLVAERRSAGDSLFALNDAHARIAARGEGATAAMIAALDGASVLRRWHAITALSFASSAVDRACSALVTTLTDSHGLLRRHARWALHRLAPRSTAAIMEALAHSDDDERAAALLDALAYSGPAACGASGWLRETNRDRALETQVFREIDGPWDPDPERPVEYLGEHVRFFAYASTTEGEAGRLRYEAAVWCDGASWFAQHAEFDEATFDDPTTWTAELESLACRTLDRWTPARIGLARPAISLCFYDHELEDEREVEVRATDPHGFSMGALLHQTQLVYDREAGANDRVFEGLRRVGAGRYRIVTGS